MRSVSFVDLRKQCSLHKEELTKSIWDVVESGRFIGGEKVREFERNFASYCGCRYGVGTASGSDALRLSLLALDVGPGDEVVTVSHTFVSTVDAIVHVGATPVFVDIDPHTYTMDPNKLAKAIGPKVKAVIPVHLYGQPAEMAPIMETCERWNIPVVEDASQAHGATYAGKPCGSIGSLACFSFYPSKNLGAFGDAGFISTNNEELTSKLQLLREYGQREKYHHELVGFNSRLDAIQASVLDLKLKYLDYWNENRRRLAGEYNNRLAEDSEIIIPAERSESRHVFHIYAIRLQDRESLMTWLRKNGIETGIHYPLPVHLQPAYSTIKCRSLDLTVTEMIAKEILSLPMFPELTQDDLNYVVENISTRRPLIC